MTLLFRFGIWLVGSLGGGVADRILSHLERKADIENGRDKLRAEVTVETVRSELAVRQAARDIVLAEQGWWVTALIRPAFAWPIAIWSGAVVADSLFHFTWNVAALPAPSTNGQAGLSLRISSPVPWKRLRAASFTAGASAS
ncbi:hypothetical protein [Pannonibacter sp. SL95]|uniref:hypothetical protein n=1 Tax=Pannonibacter sp. SL95 TaxID=2995153 RepID=UPI0022757315|nr:hypothetical protein [Pannonibacter sp. SL95]MCY1706442.1 hypothetical protein [Pannonibacter sp. SL95]